MHSTGLRKGQEEAKHTTGSSRNTASYNSMNKKTNSRPSSRNERESTASTALKKKAAAKNGA